MNIKSKELADASIKAFGDFVDRKLAPVVASVGGIAQRMDRHFASIEALEKRIAALERRDGLKAAPVRLDTARDR